MSFRSFLSNKILLVCLLVISAQSVQSQTRLPAIISSNMVLQQQEMVPLWGWDTPGQEIWITTSWSNATAIAECNDEGEWNIPIRTPKQVLDLI